LDHPIPLPNVNSKILSKVIEYCKYHVEAAKPDAEKVPSEEEKKAFDLEFVQVDQATLFELILVQPVSSRLCSPSSPEPSSPYLETIITGRGRLLSRLLN
jgi:hypothetical protein